MTQDILAIHRGREVCYSFLSRFFLEMPTEKLLKELENLLPLLKSFNEAEDVDINIKEGVEGIENFLAERNAKKGDDLKNFDMDTLRAYTGIFCLTGSVFITESAYLSQTHTNMEAQRDQVLAMYKHWSFEMKCESNEPEDHISYELMFMSYLAHLTQVVIESNVSQKKYENTLFAQASFLNEHLLKWLDIFVKKICGYLINNNAILYRVVAKFMLGFILLDYVFLEDECSNIKQ